MTQQRVLIAGCGYVGVALGLSLARQGHDVWGLRRNAAALPSEIRAVNADLSQREQLLQLPTNLTHIVFAAAPSSSDDVAYNRTYVQGLTHLLSVPQLSHDAFRRFIFVSSTAVYGQVGGEVVDEHSATQPSHFSGLRTLEAERVLARSGRPYTILRCGGIYGPGRTRLIDTVKAAQAKFSLDRVEYSNRIHRDDVAGALEHLMFLEHTSPLYLGVDEDNATRKEVLEWLAQRVGAPPPVRVEKTGTRAARSNKRCSGDLLRNHGYRFKYPTFREGYSAMLDHAEQQNKSR